MLGTDIQRTLEKAQRQVEQTTERADQALRSASSQVDRLVATQGRLTQELARAVVAEAPTGRSGLAQQIAEAIAQRDEQRVGTKKQLDQQRKAVAELQAQAAEAEAAAVHAYTQAQAVEAQALEGFNATPDAQRDETQRALLTQVLGNVRTKTEQAEQDARQKAPAYEHDPLFAYLLERGYGLPSYAGVGVFAVLDGWVARLVDFPRHFADYQRLKAIPERMREHTHAVATSLADLERSTGVAYEAAMDAWPGLKAARAAVKRAEQARDQARTRLDTAQTLAQRLDGLLTAFARGDDRHSEQATALVTRAIERNAAELQGLVASTASRKDDRLLERLQETQQALAQAHERVAQVQRERKAAQERLGNVQRFLRRFKDARLGSENRHYDRADTGAWAQALVAGVALDDLLATLHEQSYHQAPQPAYTPSYSGSSSSSSSSSSSDWGGSSSSSSSGGFGGSDYSTGGSSGGGDYSTGGGF